MSLRDALPAGTVVGEFEIRRVLGQGGFGIVYEAWEPMLERRVALKEYFLQGFSRREGLEVVPADVDAVEMFDSGMSRFIREARLLSMLNERTRTDGSLVAVYRVFQQHRTAFMAMKLYEGQTMRQQILGSTERVSEAWLVSLLQRMLDALEALHSLPGENLVHRDVSPDNIILQPDGRPVLLDFGATRKASDAQTSLIYKPGYSPIEQYTDAIRQGPWTDLYALSGVAYFAITRQSPMPAVDRYAGAQFVTATERGAGRFTPEFLALVDHGMAVLPEQRFQNAEQMRAAIAGLPTPYVTRTGALPSPSRAAAMPTATFVAPPATTPLSATQQGQPPDNEVTLVRQTPDPAGVPTATWAPTPMPSLGGATSARPAMAGTATPGGGASRTGLWAGLGTAAVVAAGLALWQPWRVPAGGAGSGAASAAGGGTAVTASTPTTMPASDSPPSGPLGQSGQPTSNAASAASAGPVTTQPVPPANVPGLACTEATADWACVLDGLARLSTTPPAITLRVTPAEARIGQAITLELSARSDGVLQLLTVDDSPNARLQLLFPNHLDRNNRMRADTPLTLPRRPRWDLQAQPPRGRYWAIAVLSDQPLAPPKVLRDGLRLKDAVQAFAGGTPLTLLGVSDCTAASGAAAATGAGCPKTLSIQPADFIIR